MSRRRVLTITLLGVVAVACVGSLWSTHTAEQARQREAGYQLALRSYSEALKSGTTRKEVEGYLRMNGAAFRHQCCIDKPGSDAWDDLVKIGQEKPPWYCGEHNVYVAFSYDAAEPHPVPQANDSDTLRKVQIFHGFESCL